MSMEIAADASQWMIVSDESGLRQVLLNVILNAMDVTPEGGKASVRVKRDDTAGQVIIEVDDAGPGLGDRDPEELFQPFTTTKTHGTGLGLAVSRQILDQLGGSITLANRTGRGASCKVTLPVAATLSQGQVTKAAR